MRGTLPQPERPGYLSFLPNFLFRAERPFAYVLMGWLLVLLPSILLSLLVNSSAPTAEGPRISVDSTSLILMLVVGAPVIETMIMVLPLLLLNRLFGFGPAVLLSAAGWGIAHSLAAWNWGLVVWWPFLIFSIALLVWRKRSLLLACLLVAAIHALQNGLGAALLVIAAAGSSSPS